MYVHVYSEPLKKSWKNYGFKVHKKAAKLIKLFENQMGYFLLKLYFSIQKKSFKPIKLIPCIMQKVNGGSTINFLSQHYLDHSFWNFFINIFYAASQICEYHMNVCLKNSKDMGKLKKHIHEWVSQTINIGQYKKLSFLASWIYNLHFCHKFSERGCLAIICYQFPKFPISYSSFFESSKEIFMNESHKPKNIGQ